MLLLGRQEFADEAAWIAAGMPLGCCPSAVLGVTDAGETFNIGFHCPVHFRAIGQPSITFQVVSAREEKLDRFQWAGQALAPGTREAPAWSVKVTYGGAPGDFRRVGHLVANEVVKSPAYQGWEERAPRLFAERLAAEERDRAVRLGQILGGDRA